MIGIKCSGFMCFIGLWGFIFLSILGGLFYNQSVGLFEDLPEEEYSDIINYTWDERVANFTKQYHQNAYNSWIAAGAHLVMGLVGMLRLMCIIRR